jgi:Homeodomain-like domain
MTALLSLVRAMATRSRAHLAASTCDSGRCSSPLDVFSVTRRWLHQFNAIGIDGLGNRPGCGRKQRITEAERSRIIALARSLPRGQPARDVTGELSTDDEGGPAQWS